MIRTLSHISLLALATSLLSSCLVRRTVTTGGGQTVEQGYAIKRPVKDAIKNSR